MGFANIRRPQIIPRLNLENVLCWNKRTSDNIDLINQRYEYVELTMTHGTELLIDNPRDGAPVGFLPIMAVDETGVPALPVQSVALDTTRTDGQLGLTAKYALPVGESLTIVKTSNQTLTTAIDTVVTFVAGTGSNDASGDAMTFASNGITLIKPGLYNIVAQIVFDANATGGRILFVRRNTFRLIDYSGAPNPTGGNGTNVQASGMLAVTSAQAEPITVSAIQQSGGNLNILGNGATDTRLGGNSGRCWLQATRIRNDETPTYTVRGWLLY